METPVITVAQKGNAKLQYYDWTIGDSTGKQWGICVPEREPFPNMGFDPKRCPHPTEFAGHYFSDGALGHGSFCTLCGQFLQAG
jgi:hypothetical protein